MSCRMAKPFFDVARLMDDSESQLKHAAALHLLDSSQRPHPFPVTVPSSSTSRLCSSSCARSRHSELLSALTRFYPPESPVTAITGRCTPLPPLTLEATQFSVG